MRKQRLIKAKRLCHIGQTVFITCRNGNKYVTIIKTPKVTEVITYKAEKEQYLDTFKKIRLMTKEKNCEYEIDVEDLWKYYKYYTED